MSLKVWYVAFVTVFLLYIVILWYGTFLFLGTLPFMSVTWASLLSLLFALIVWGLCVLNGRLLQKNNGWTPASFVTFAALFLCSGLAIANAAFYHFETGNVIRSIARQASETLNQAKIILIPRMESENFRIFQDNVDSKLSSIVDEVVNQTVVDGKKFCGIGKSGDSLIAEMREYLPQFTELNGTRYGQLNCDDAASVQWAVSQYKAKAEELVKSSAVYREERMAERSVRISDATTTLTQFGDELNAIIEKSDNISFSFHRQSDEVIPIIQRLEAIEKGVRELADEVEPFIDEGEKAAAAPIFEQAQNGFDASSLRELGNILNALPTILSAIVNGRAGFETIFYAVIPFLIDFGVVSLIRATIARLPRRPSRVSTVISDGKSPVLFILPSIPEARRKA